MSARDPFARPFVRPETLLGIADGIARLAPIYAEHGALVFPGLFRDDPDFVAYRDELARLANMMLDARRPQPGPALPFDEVLTELARLDRPAVGKLFDLGTRPAKLLSAMRLKTHPAIVALCDMALGAGALLATPNQSDTLHIFPPGAENFRFNLPAHQDYPYLLQSPRQVTFWINFGAFAPDVGGVAFWAGSHGLGILPQRRNEHRQFKAEVTDEQLAPFPRFDVIAGAGDLVVMNSLTVHSSIENHTADSTRVVQLFRYSDLTDPQAIRMQWQSADFRGAGLTFEAAHPELVTG